MSHIIPLNEICISNLLHISQYNLMLFKKHIRLTIVMS